MKSIKNLMSLIVVLLTAIVNFIKLIAPYAHGAIVLKYSIEFDPCRVYALYEYAFYLYAVWFVLLRLGSVYSRIEDYEYRRNLKRSKALPRT